MKDFAITYDMVDKDFVLSCVDEDEEGKFILLEVFEGTTTIAEVNKLVVEKYGCTRLDILF